ncbi:hypothetical protein [Bartonella sp. DGB2]|uniref:hypothetical protein n=1 Tax=Bartonella sp. DGB2 TaxID=3388426 RepID=UPI0039901147
MTSLSPKYRLLRDESITKNGHTLYRIQAMRDFANVKAGDLGGFVESEDNLSHEGDCWVGGNARVGGNAHIDGDRVIDGDTVITAEE